MKISENTLEVMKNYASINSNLYVNKGSTLSTISPGKSIFSECVVGEEFDVEFGIWDLNKFLSVVSLFKDPDFTFNAKFVDIKGATSNVRYFYAEKSLLTVPTKKIGNVKYDVSFTLSEKDINSFLKASQVLQISDIRISSEGKDKPIFIGVVDANDETSNTYMIEVGLNKTDSNFEMYMKSDNLKLLPGNYNVNISEKGLAQFCNDSCDLKYWIALESNSKFNTQ